MRIMHSHYYNTEVARQNRKNSLKKPEEEKTEKEKAEEAIEANEAEETEAAKNEQAAEAEQKKEKQEQLAAQNAKKDSVKEEMRYYQQVSENMKEKYKRYQEISEKHKEAREKLEKEKINRHRNMLKQMIRSLQSRSGESYSKRSWGKCMAAYRSALSVCGSQSASAGSLNRARAQLMGGIAKLQIKQKTEKAGRSGDKTTIESGEMVRGLNTNSAGQGASADGMAAALGAAPGGASSGGGTTV